MIDKEKMKEWLVDKKEKGVKWCKDNRGILCYLLGTVTTAAGVIAAEKVYSKVIEAQLGCIEFTPLEDGKTLVAHVYTKDRFDRETNVVNIAYDIRDPYGNLLKMSDALEQFIFPGD